MRRVYAVLVLAGLLLCLSAAVCQASGTGYSAEFAELNQVFIDISIDNPDAVISDEEGIGEELLGFLGDEIEIALFPDLAVTDDENAPMLVLNVGVYSCDGGYYGYVELKVWRKVTLADVSAPEPFDCVVYESEYSITGSEGVEDQIMEIAAELLDEFVATYEEALW